MSEATVVVSFTKTLAGQAKPILAYCFAWHIVHVCEPSTYGIPKRTKLDDTQNNCQTDLHIKQLSNLSRTIVKLVQNNCQTATHKILCTLCLKRSLCSTHAPIKVGIGYGIQDTQLRHYTLRV